MLCYYCLKDAVEARAVAICRRCGGAVCRTHVCEVRFAQPPVGLLPGSHLRLELMCRGCGHGYGAPSGRSVRTQTLDAHSLHELPDAQAAIRAAEQLLHSTRPTTAPVDTRNHHRHLWSWLAHGLRLLRVRIVQRTVIDQMSDTAGPVNEDVRSKQAE